MPTTSSAGRWSLATRSLSTCSRSTPPPDRATGAGRSPCAWSATTCAWRSARTPPARRSRSSRVSSPPAASSTTRCSLRSGPAAERQRLELHQHEADVLDGLRVAGGLAGRDLLLDLRDVLEHAPQRAGELLPALGVEPQGGPGDVRVAAVEASGGVGRAPVVVDLLQRGADRRLLGDGWSLLPRVIGDPWPFMGPVMALDGAPDTRLALELDQAELVELADVVGDDAYVGVQDPRQLDRAGGPLLEDREDAHAERMPECADVARVADVLDLRGQEPIPTGSRV